MKRWIGLVLVLGLLPLSGCGYGLPQNREMDNIALMRTMGVDPGEQAGQVWVTVSSDRRARGVQGEEEPPLLLSAQRETVAGACQAVQGQSGSDVFFGHLDQLVLGEELARNGGVQELLEHFSRDPELGLGTRVWLVRGDTARAAMQSQRDTGIAQRLSALVRDSGMGSAGLECTAGEALSALLEGECAVIPALTLAGEGETASLEQDGYGVLQGGALAFWLTGQEARGLELSRGCPGPELLELEQAVVRLERAELTCVPVLEGAQLAGLELDLRVIARVEQPRQEEFDREQVRQAVQEQTGRWLTAAVELAQRENADFLGLARQAGTAQPECWKLLREQWARQFPRLDIRTRCTAVLTDVRK